MAKMSSVLTVTVLSDITRMKKGMNDATKSLKGFERDVKQTSSGINKLLGGIGVGLSISGLVNMAKAASSDAKSFNLMSLAIKNATGATDEQIMSSERYVQAMSNQLGILDDELRPALSTLTQVYGDATLAQGALTVAADLAAYKGISVTEAASAMAKAIGGNTKALGNMIPALKSSKTPLEDLQRLVKGSAEAAANSDPFQRISVIFDNLSETLGQYLLPYLNAFGEWLASAPGQEFIANVANSFGAIATYVFNLIGWLGDNTWLINTAIGLVAIIKLMKTMFVVSKAIYGVTKAIGISEMVIAAVKAFPGQAAIVAGLAMFTTAGLAFGALDSLFGGMPTLTLPSLDASTFTPAAFQQLPGASKQSGIAKVAKKPADEIKKALATMRKSLAEVRAGIAKMAATFRNSVDIAIGLVSRRAGMTFRADRYVAELNRMRRATADFQTNLAKLQAMGGKAANPLLEQILNKSPEEAAAILRGFAQSPDLFNQAITASAALASTGRGVGRAVSQMQGNQTEQQLLAEIKLLRNDLSTGKNTYNIKSDMTATEIVAAIRKWEKSTGRKVLVG